MGRWDITADNTMKKLLVLLVVTCATVSMFATDIIVTRDAQRIEAKIMEVSSSEIKYKEANNLEGPMFVLSTSEINTIIYSNGTVKVFDHATTPGYNQQNANSNGYSVNNANLLPITKSSGFYYLGEQRMTEDQYIDYIRSNCRDAWDSYNSGKKLWRAGWSLFGVGLGLEVLGGGLLGGGIGDSDAGLIVSGGVFAGVGGAFVIASTPCIIVGGIRKYNSHVVYNNSCAARQTAVTFGLKPASGGIGLTMNF